MATNIAYPTMNLSHMFMVRTSGDPGVGMRKLCVYDPLTTTTRWGWLIRAKDTELINGTVYFKIIGIGY